MNGPVMRASKRNRLIGSPVYAKILTLYNEELKKAHAAGKKINNKKFYEEYVLPDLPGYAMQSWYMFLKRYKTTSGIIAAEVPHELPEGGSSIMDPDAAITKTVLTNQEATAKALSLALNIGMDRLQAIMENPQMMTAKEAVDLVFKAMKAQDSRIHAIGKVREDNREEEKMDRAFADGAYG